MTLKEQTYTKIKKAVLTGELTAGRIYSHGDLAIMLGVSRTPVREAISVLEKEGLVEIIPFKGIKFLNISREEMNQIIEVRKAIESTVVKKSVEKISNKDIQKLGKLVENMKVSLEKEDWNKFKELDKEFHRTIIEGTGNPVFTEIWDMLFQRIAINPSKNRFILAMKSHEKILSEIKNRDAEAAYLALVEHLEITYKNFLGMDNEL